MPQIESLLKFSDNFTSVVEAWKNRNQQESQFSQKLDFQNRQLSLREAFRRDELDETISYHKVLSDYYDSQDENQDLNRDVNIQRGKNQLMINDMFPVDENTPEGTSTFEAYGETWVNPAVESPEPIEQSRFVPGAFGTQVEQKFTVDEAGNETIRNYETVIYPSEVRDDDNSFDTYYNTGVSYLSELRSLNQQEAGGSIQYNEAKQKATLNSYQALDAVGISKDILEGLRMTIEGIPPEESKEREKILNEAINKLNREYDLTEEQLKALKLWKDVGTQ